MSKFVQNKIKVAFDTLGCAKNTCDTASMQKHLVQSGFDVVSDVEDSDVIVLNTCSFIVASAQESIDTFYAYKQAYPQKKIVVVGCLCSRYGNQLEAEMVEADGFLACKDEEKLPHLLRDICNNFCGYVSGGKIFSDKNAEDNVAKTPGTDQTKKESLTFSYVKISEGCNRFCSYCTIPYIRGRYHSSSLKEILSNVEDCVNCGAKEIVLVAQDCGEWGKDFEKPSSLAFLLDTLAERFADTVFRVLYVLPDNIDNELLEVLKKHKNIVNYLDIPFQHCSEHIVKDMNRSGNYDSYLEMVKQIRDELPECVLRTTLIVGFPGETDEDFDELCSFVQEADFDYAGVFEYSREEGTKAYSLPNQVDEQVKHDRLNALRQIADDISISKLDDRIGSSYDILIEGIDSLDGDRPYGRAWFQAPEVDGYVFVEGENSKKSVSVGDKVFVKITGSELYDLVAEIE